MISSCINSRLLKFNSSVKSIKNSSVKSLEFWKEIFLITLILVLLEKSVNPLDNWIASLTVIPNLWSKLFGLLTSPITVILLIDSKSFKENTTNLSWSNNFIFKSFSSLRLIEITSSSTPLFVL